MAVLPASNNYISDSVKSPVGFHSFVRIIGSFLLLGIVIAAVSLNPGFLNNFKFRRMFAYANKLQNEASGIKFSGDLSKNRFEDNLKKIRVEKTPKGQFDLFSREFTILIVQYQNDHLSQTRTVAEGLKNFLAKSYPDLYGSAKFSIQCLDSGCAKANYPDEVKGVLAILDGSKVSKEDLAPIKLALEAAAFNNNKDEQFSPYDAAFQHIFIVYNKSKDQKVKEAGVKLLAFMDGNFKTELSRVRRSRGEAAFVFIK